MSRITAVIPNDNFTLEIDFEQGDKVFYSMAELIKTAAFKRLNNLQYFKQVKFEDKAIFWGEISAGRCFPERLTLDNILFSLRE